jgi:hypothetical protein
MTSGKYDSEGPVCCCVCSEGIRRKNFAESRDWLDQPGGDAHSELGSCFVLLLWESVVDLKTRLFTHSSPDLLSCCL